MIHSSNGGIQRSEPGFDVQHTILIIIIKKIHKWNYIEEKYKIKRSYHLPTLDVVIIICQIIQILTNVHFVKVMPSVTEFISCLSVHIFKMKEGNRIAGGGYFKNERKFTDVKFIKYSIILIKLMKNKQRGE